MRHPIAVPVLLVCACLAATPARAATVPVPTVQDATGPSEKDLRETFRKGIRSPDPSARIEAVATLGNASRSLPDGGSSKLMARTLAGALDDDDMGVRAAAVGALAWGRHVETVVDVLGDLLPELRQEVAALSTRPDEESRTRRAQTARLYEATCVALGRHPDDRSVEALVDEIRKMRPRTGTQDASELLVGPVSSGLLALGSQESVGQVVKLTTVFSGSVLINRVSEGTAKELHVLLSAFSEDLGYGPPAWSDTYDQSWRTWFQEHEDDLPKELGKLEEPVPAPEYRRPERVPDRRRPGQAERP